MSAIEFLLLRRYAGDDLLQDLFDVVDSDDVRGCLRLLHVMNQRSERPSFVLQQNLSGVQQDPIRFL